jgi:hypothetical protein
LQALGFELRAETSTYAGSQVCSFLDFVRGPALELIEVADAQKYLDFVPPGMEPFSPGISLIAAKGSVLSFADLERELHDLDPYRVHVSYDGSDDAAAPGWNYLNFGKEVVPGTFVWCTAFDEPRPGKQHPVVHPNEIAGVEGLVFDLPMHALKGLADLAEASMVDGVLRIGEIDVWTREAAGLPRQRDKTFPLVAVVLGAPTPDRLGLTNDTTEITFASRPAVLVRMNRLSWDLLIRARSA